MMRIGLLSASRISLRALMAPARDNDRVEVAAVGARSLDTADAFAAEHGVARAYGSYEELILDDALDAIYVSNPASLHAEWSVAALEAGRHVLCEKPLAGNSPDAQRMVDAASRSGQLLMEAFHWRFHPFAARMIEQVSRLERPIEIDAEFSIPQISKTDIRYQFDLGGGALMDLGCYPVHWIRCLVGEPDAVEAEMTSSVDRVDDTTSATMRFSDGSTARMTTSMAAIGVVRELKAKGGNGSVFARNPLAPHEGNLLRWETDGESGEEEVAGPTTYAAQLEAFVDLVDGKEGLVIAGADSVNNMATIDRMYESAGLGARP